MGAPVAVIPTPWMEDGSAPPPSAPAVIKVWPVRADWLADSRVPRTNTLTRVATKIHNIGQATSTVSLGNGSLQVLGSHLLLGAPAVRWLKWPRVEKCVHSCAYRGLQTHYPGVVRRHPGQRSMLSQFGARTPNPAPQKKKGAMGQRVLSVSRVSRLNDIVGAASSCNMDTV